MHIYIYTPQNNLRTTKWKWYNFYYLFCTKKTIYFRNYYISVVNKCKEIYYQITVVNTWGVKRCGHYRNLNVCISVGGAWNFIKQHCNMFQATLKVRQIKHMATSSIENNRTYTSEAANQFSDWRKTNSCPILNERVCEVIPHLWLSWPSTCMFWSLYHTCSC